MYEASKRGMKSMFVHRYLLALDHGRFQTQGDKFREKG
jgi:hypothetical protein